jgi:hypothetical protein
MKKQKIPTIRYDKIIEGPALRIALPEPRNNPVPMAPPMAII